MSIFAKNKNAFCTTNLIIKVKMYDGGSPLFYLDKVINDSEKGWKTQYFSKSFTY